MLSYRQVLDELLAAAREAGMDEATLARAADIPPEWITLCKRPSSQDLATLNNLAAVLDKRIALSPVWLEGPPDARPTWVITPPNTGRKLH